MIVTRVAGEYFDLDPAGVERAVAGIDPEPIREHYVVIGRRRYPPKQVLAARPGAAQLGSTRSALLLPILHRDVPGSRFRA